MNDNWFLICDLSLLTNFFPIHDCDLPIGLKLKGILAILMMHTIFCGY